MCRSIKTLRPPYTDEVGPAETTAAALQYVRKIAGMRAPSRVNQPAFDEAVRQVEQATAQLLASLTIAGPAAASAVPAGAVQRR
jgi:hypothetical protein